MQIRSAHAADQVAIDSFAAGHGHGAGVPAPRGEFRECVVAEIDGAGVVAVGTVNDLPFHPKVALLRIDVASAFRGQGIGSTVHDHIAATAMGYDLLARGYADEIEGRGFLRRRGFTTTLKSLYGKLDPNSPDVIAWRRRVVDAAAGSYRIETVAADDAVAAVCTVQAQIVVAQHAPMPTRLLSQDEAVEFFGRRAVPGSIARAWIGEELVGAGSLFRHTPSGVDKLFLPDEIQLLSQVGPVDETHAEARGVTASLVAHCLAAATTTVVFDVHDTQPNLWSVLEEVPYLERSDEYVLVFKKCGDAL